MLTLPGYEDAAIRRRFPMSEDGWYWTYWVGVIGFGLACVFGYMLTV